MRKAVFRGKTVLDVGAGTRQGTCVFPCLELAVVLKLFNDLLGSPSHCLSSRTSNFFRIEPFLVVSNMFGLCPANPLTKLVFFHGPTVFTCCLLRFPSSRSTTKKWVCFPQKGGCLLGVPSKRRTKGGTPLHQKRHPQGFCCTDASGAVHVSLGSQRGLVGKRDSNPWLLVEMRSFPLTSKPPRQNHQFGI